MSKQYPILDMDTLAINDEFKMEDTEHAVNQFKAESSILEVENYDKESLNKLLSAHMLLPRGDRLEHVTFMGRNCHQDGH